MKQTIEIDIPDGYEFVRFGVPQEGEQYLSPAGRVVTAAEPFDTFKFAIVRPAWQWPVWLKAEWIAMDEDGAWWAYMQEPCIQTDRRWFGECGPLSFREGYFDFTPPCTDWRQSLRRRPQ